MASAGRTLAVHADWSVAASKRWMAVAAGAPWRVRVEPVGPVDTLLERLRQEAGGAPVLLGVDAPVGLPIAYARLHVTQRDFTEFLRSLAADAPFFSVCKAVDEVTGARPFFPHNAKSSPRRSEHAARLGIAADEMLRRCDRAEGRRPAASLFWTLGANQVGKAALALWRDVLLPGLASPDPPALWPFDGALHDLLATRSLTIAETYPAEALSRLQPHWRGSKRLQADRAGLAATILAALDGIHLPPPLRAEIEDGFGPLPTGEDRFDGLLGLLAMLKAIREPGETAAPPSADVRQWEGWILGQRAV